jgi:integrase
VAQKHRNIERKTLPNGQVRYYVRLTVNGKRRSFGGFRTLHEALDRLRVVEKMAAGGTLDKEEEPPPPPPLTLRDLHDQYMKAQEKAVQPSTYRSMKIAFDKHILPVLGDLPLKTIDGEVIQDWVNGMSNKGLAPATVGKCYRYLRACFWQGVTWDKYELVRNPCRKTILPRIDKTRPPQFLDAGQIKVLLGESTEPHRTLYATLGYSGLRLGEGLALRWLNIDFKKRQINVEFAWTTDGYFSDLKTTSSYRRVPIFPILEKRLREYQKAQENSLPDTLLFAQKDDEGKPKDKPISQSNALRVFQRTLKQVGLPEETVVHSLRHSYASIILHSGGSIKVLQEWMGHSTVTETLNTYSHLIYDENLDRVKALANEAFEEGKSA